MIRPQHQVAEVNVDVPTLVYTTVKAVTSDLETTGVHLQWFGMSTPPTPDDAQFFFPINKSIDDKIWQDKLETFRVAFVGQLKDWPNLAAAESIADQISHKSLEGWVIYIVSGEVVVNLLNDPNYGIMSSIVLPLNVMLADPYYGPITPRPYQDFTIIDQEMAKINSAS